MASCISIEVTKWQSNSLNALVILMLALDSTYEGSLSSVESRRYSRFLRYSRPMTCRKNAICLGQRRPKVSMISRSNTLAQASKLVFGIASSRPFASFANSPKALPLRSETALTLAQAVALVRQQCDPVFLDAVRKSGKFLYRGENLFDGHAALMQPTSDLLELSTYGSPSALAYFQDLEASLSQIGANVSPSKGHIGVSRMEAAGLWGEVVSVWPLGKPLHFVSPKYRYDFYPDTQKIALSSLGGSEGYNIDVGLANALQQGREILFASEAGADFVAIASKHDGDVRRLLMDASKQH